MVTVLLVIFAGSYLLVCLAILGSRKPGYSHFAHTISELGDYGSENQWLVAFGVFLPVGLALLGAAAFLKSQAPAAAGLALCIGIGYLGAAVFPCDPGSPMHGSVRQAVHNLAGAIEYLGGGLALMVLAEDFGTGFRMAGFGVFMATFALTVLPSTTLRGLVQRIAETLLFGALFWVAWLVQVGN